MRVPPRGEKQLTCFLLPQQGKEEPFEEGERGGCEGGDGVSGEGGDGVSGEGERRCFSQLKILCACTCTVGHLFTCTM